MYSTSEENYLWAIHSLSQDTDQLINTNAIAEKMQTKAASVTDMLKKLSEKGLLEYQRYKGVRLTEQGAEVANGVDERNELWNRLLKEKMGVANEEASSLADQLKHVNSENLVNTLHSFLGKKAAAESKKAPKEEKKSKKSKEDTLADLKKKDMAELLAMDGLMEDTIKRLKKKGLTVGKKLKVIREGSDDQKMVVRTKKDEFKIPNSVAKRLMVKKEKKK